MDCECGCGQPVRIPRNRFVIGHNARVVHAAADLFWPRVQQSDGCWLWTGYKTTDGYGVFSAGRRGNRQRHFAHRFSWNTHFGPIPEGMMVCHMCDNPPCVNPEHLFLGTNLDNHRDMWKKGRGFRASITGEAHYKARVTADQVREIRRRVAAGEVQRQLAREFGLSTTGLHHIVKGTSWRDIIDPAAPSD